MKYHSAFASTVLLLSVGLAAGCGKQTAFNPDVGQPVTLTLYKYQVSLTDQEFQKFFVDPVKEKFPNVTLNIVTGSSNQNSPDHLLASGENIDLIYTSDNGEIFGLPFSLNFAALFYNKDIFDKMGVPYPTDSMTWEDVLELSKKLTKMDGTTQYLGIVPPTPFQFGQQLSLPYVDRSTNQAVLGTPGWQQMMEAYRSFFLIPGIVTDDGKIPSNTKSFLTDKTEAMIANWQDTLVGPLIEMSQSGQGFNWDMATYPSLKQAPGQGRAADFHLLMIANTSKQKELAFEIMQYLTSDPVQLKMTQNGRMTSLNNQQMELSFGENLPGFKGKNIAGALKSKPSAIFPSDFDNLVTDQLGQAGVRVATGKQDINTALRQALDAANQAIATAVKQSK